jgi:4-cresol dehydrogenase (hydroxylating) flavoprotein subunit
LIFENESGYCVAHCDIHLSALEEFEQILGSDNIILRKESIRDYSQNTDGLTREVPAVLFPESKEEVQAVVQAANEFGICLYPVSCGKNWGLGTRLPVRDGSIIVDLSRMNRILEVNTQHGYAVIEPGVTQKQLHDYLTRNQIPFLLNVTGSSSQTSVIGNALDRGVGYFSSRVDSLSGMEIVLGSGEILKTGFSHYPTAKTQHIYRHGVGPSLDGLFSQSNFGIVVSAGVDLMPKPEACVGLAVSLYREEDLPAFIDRFASLRRDGVIQTVAHIAEKNRTIATLGPLVFRILSQRMDPEEARIETETLLKAEGFGPWSAMIGLMGRANHVNSIAKIVKNEFKGIAKVRVLTDQRLQWLEALCSSLSFIPFFNRKQAILEAMKPIYGLSKGIPTDAALPSLYWAIGELPPEGTIDPDRSPCGMLSCLPILPTVGSVVQEVMGEIRKISDRYQTPICTTLNTIDSKSLETVITIHFHKADEKSQAYDCLKALQDYFFKEGYLPYRVGIESMSAITDEDDSFWQTANSLKSIFDPRHIISPGRYNLS